MEIRGNLSQCIKQKVARSPTSKHDTMGGNGGDGEKNKRCFVFSFFIIIIIFWGLYGVYIIPNWLRSPDIFQYFLNDLFGPVVDLYTSFLSSKYFKKHTKIMESSFTNIIFSYLNFLGLRKLLKIGPTGPHFVLMFCLESPKQLGIS